MILRVNWTHWYGLQMKTELGKPIWIAFKVLWNISSTIFFQRKNPVGLLFLFCLHCILTLALFDRWWSILKSCYKYLINQACSGLYGRISVLTVMTSGKGRTWFNVKGKFLNIWMCWKYFHFLQLCDALRESYGFQLVFHYQGCLALAFSDSPFFVFQNADLKSTPYLLFVINNHVLHDCWLRVADLCLLFALPR